MDERTRDRSRQLPGFHRLTRKRARRNGQATAERWQKAATRTIAKGVQVR